MCVRVCVGQMTSNVILKTLLSTFFEMVSQSHGIGVLVFKNEAREAGQGALPRVQTSLPL